MFLGCECIHIYATKQSDLRVQTADKNLKVLCIEPLTLTLNAVKIASSYEQRHTPHCFGEYLPIINKLGVIFF
jgi:hypothetical protein